MLGSLSGLIKPARINILIALDLPAPNEAGKGMADQANPLGDLHPDTHLKE
jgi:hypothetical protein